MDQSKSNVSLGGLLKKHWLKLKNMSSACTIRKWTVGTAPAFHQEVPIQGTNFKNFRRTRGGRRGGGGG